MARPGRRRAGHALLNPRAPLVTPTRRHAAPGRCIYCLASGVPLSEEHLVPKSLGGRATLPEAVCGPCRIATGRLEQVALAAQFVVPRALLTIRRRRARTRTQAWLPAVALAGETAPGSGRMHVDDYPRGFELPVFDPARRLGPAAAGDVAWARCRLHVGTPRGDALAARPPLDDPFAFAWSLAKWAYGLAVAERGLEALDGGGMRELLAGERHDVFDFVGSAAAPVATGARPHALHEGAVEERDGWLVVRLHLFAAAGMRPYEIVAGAATRRARTQSPSADGESAVE